MSQKLAIREATEKDCAAVAKLSAQTFSESFGHLYKPENLEKHLLTHSSESYFGESLQNGESVLMVELGDKLIGYGKVGHLVLPVKKPPRNAQEIHRVYIDKSYQGKGYGRALMLHILSLPRLTTAHHTYLSVWEDNLRAQSLYKQHGFDSVGHYLYYVGDQADRELIMVRNR